MTRTLALICAGICFAAISGCGGGDADTDGGSDSADAGSETNRDCTGVTDGELCGTAMICVAESCVLAECGDGFVDESAGEECDDGNGQAFDGCEPTTCLFTCDDDIQCDDREACNGLETCSSADHFCVVAAFLDDTTRCDLDGSDGVCRSGGCVAPGCGNSVPDGDEHCDDGNEMDGDGCDTDCTFSCIEDEDCSDGDVCTGTESCDTVTHTCQPGTNLSCEGGDACTLSECDPVDGCRYPLIDGDGDGYASTELGVCGTDCNDDRTDVNPGEQELCDITDHDCSGVPEPAGTPYWYVDCDGDGYSLSLTGSIQSCEEPAVAMGPCTGSVASPWTTRRPDSSASTDCNDSNAEVHPGQGAYFTTPISGGSFDYDCSAPLPITNGTQYRYTTSRVSSSGACSSDPRVAFSCGGSAGYTGYRAACGVTASYTYCRYAICRYGDPGCIGGCGRVTVQRTQECR